MHAVVTGCAGFIGSHLSERLIADGWRVTGIDALTPYYDPAAKEQNLSGLSREPRFELLRNDLNDAPLERIFKDRPAIFHLAAQPGVRASFGDGFNQYLHDNVQATQRIMETALAAGVSRLVYASSSSIYGDAASYPCVEDHTPSQPRSPYGVTKRMCELLASVYRQSGLESVGLRYFTVYGPRQRPDMAMRRLCEAAVGGPTFTLFGDGNQSRDFTYVTDAVSATIRAGSTVAPPQVVNVGGGQEATMKEVIALISTFSEGALSIDYADAQRGDVRRTGADTRKAWTDLAWAPRVSLEEGLRNEFEWVKARHSVSLADESARRKARSSNMSGDEATQRNRDLVLQEAAAR